MPPRIDLRRYNITDQTTMIEFLDLIIAKVPQMVRVMKKLQLENQSLKNHNATLKETNDKLNNVAQLPQLTDANVSVSDRLAGKTFTQPSGVSEQDRIAQMQAAAQGMGLQPKAPAAPTAPDPNATIDDLEEITTDTALLPKPPSAPGQIGNLNLPNPMNTRPPVPPAPPVDPPIAGQEPPAEIVDDAPNDGVATDDIDLSDMGGEDVNTSDNSDSSDSSTDTESTVDQTGQISEADKTPVGTRVAQGQKQNKKHKRR